MFEEQMQEAQKLYKQNMGCVFSKIGHPIPSSGVSQSFSPVSPIKRCVFFGVSIAQPGPAKPLGPSATLTTMPPSCRAQVDQNGLGCFCQKKHGMKSEKHGDSW